MTGEGHGVIVMNRLGILRIQVIVALLSLLSLAECATFSRTPACPNNAASPLAPRNFGQVVDHAGKAIPVYRGGALQDCREIAFLKAHGILHVLQLDAIPESNGKRDEIDGLTVFQFSFSASTIGSPGHCDQVNQAMAYLEDSQNWPVYVHCSRGKDRTGYIVGLYERRIGRDRSSVLAELHAYGHRWLERILFGQIDRELSASSPACLAPRPRS